MERARSIRYFVTAYIISTGQLRPFISKGYEGWKERETRVYREEGGVTISSTNIYIYINTNPNRSAVSFSALQTFKTPRARRTRAHMPLSYLRLIVSMYHSDIQGPLVTEQQHVPTNRCPRESGPDEWPVPYPPRVESNPSRGIISTGVQLEEDHERHGKTFFLGGREGREKEGRKRRKPLRNAESTQYRWRRTRVKPKDENIREGRSWISCKAISYFSSPRPRPHHSIYPLTLLQLLFQPMF